MKTVSDIFLRKAAWVNPTHDIATVILLLQGHGLDGLPVVEGGQVVGMVLRKHLLGVDENRQVEEIMDASLPSLTLSDSFQEAADAMTNTGAECLPVVDGEGALLGILCQNALLLALRHPLDPLTGLPSADRLREWAIERLQAGQEITLLFLDVNDFGLFNKRYGHLVGDEVLRRLTQTLQERTDAQRDIVCRYGGDEFAIASVRTAPEAAALAEQIKSEVAQQVIPEAEGQPIDITIGWRGGQRTQEREHVHYMATVNSLINLASKDCLSKKVPSVSSKVPSSDPPGVVSAPGISTPIAASAANSFAVPADVLSALPLRLRTSLPLPLIDIKQEDQMTFIQIKWQVGA